MRVAMAFLGSGSAFTMTWVVWGVCTPGDYFANGSLLLIPSLVCAAILGAWLAYARAGAPLRVTVAGLALLSAAFWLFAPGGWWASGP